MTSLKRTALVITELRPGGGERVVIHLAEGLHRRGIETTVICTRHPGPLADHLRAAGVPIEALGSERGYDIKSLFRLRRLLRRLQPDILNVHDRSSLPYVTVANFARPTPLVYTAHGLLYGENPRTPFRYRWIRPALAAITAVAPQAAEQHRRHIGWTRDITVIPNGVPDLPRDPALREKIRRELNLSPDAVVYLAMGNARPEKAFEILIRAAAKLNKSAAVLIAGKIADDDYGRMLRQLHATAANANVHLLGFRSDTAALYSAADAFVLSSRSEGLPMVILEAMMAGLPIIATRVGGVPDVITPELGILIDPENVEQLAGAMNELQNDHERRARLGARARTIALHNYSTDSMVDGYIQRYQSLLD